MAQSTHLHIKESVRQSGMRNPRSTQAAEMQPDTGAIALRARLDPGSLSAGDVMHLQRSMGNRAVGELFAQASVQTRAAEQHPVPGQALSERAAGSANELSGPVVQRKASDTLAEPSPGAQLPSVTKAPPNTPTIQRVSVPVPKGVKLTGGNGVSVLWRKNKKSEVPHVTVGHGMTDPKKNTVPVTNFHYKYDRDGYYHWDDTNSSTHFTFRGGRPTEGIYTQTSKQARKFGITLERPASVLAPAQPEAQAAVPAPAQQRVPTPAQDVEDEAEEPESVTPLQKPEDVPERWDEDD